MTVSPMELSYPNDHLEDYEGDSQGAIPDDGLELTEHESIPTGSTPSKITPRDHSNRFDDEGPIIDPKADTEENEPVVDGNQDIVHGSPSVITVLRYLFN